MPKISRCRWDDRGSRHQEADHLHAWIRLLPALLISAMWQGNAIAGPVTAPIERETIIIPTGLDDWELAWHASRVNVHNLEWVTAGETVENWTQLFTVTRMLIDADISASQFSRWSLEFMGQDTPCIRSSFISKSRDDATFTWSAVGCDKTDDQHELVRLFRSGDYLFRIAYTRKGAELPSDIQRHWLSVLGGIERVHCCEADDKGLSSIPLLALYSSFDFNQTPDMRLWFEMERHKESGKDMAVLKSAGFPQGHEYDVFMISQSPTRSWHAMPYARGVVADDAGSLRCPNPIADRETGDLGEPGSGAEQSKESQVPVAEGLNVCEELPGAPLSDLFRLVGMRFQAGLPIAAGVRSSDGSQATYAKFFSVPIEGKDGQCTVTLELVSNDARTYVAYGSDFPANENVGIAWKYANNEQAQTVRADSTGSFIAAINHPGEASGRKKWGALLQATASQCKVSVKYKWGDAGMKP